MAYAYCCDCGIRYSYKPEEETKGRPCNCLCCCNPDEGDFEELHCEVTETSCQNCGHIVEIQCSPWNYIRGKHSMYCSEDCRREYNDNYKTYYYER